MFDMAFRAFMQAGALLIFLMFWLVSSPVYFVAECCDWLDGHVNVILKRFF